jgi:glutathione peroxidase
MRFTLALTLFFLVSCSMQIVAKPTNTPTAIINHVVKDIDGKDVNLSQYRGKTLLIVNTASFCGYTQQYADLVQIQKDYEAQGFTVLAFPSNDFGEQEPGSAQEIKSFCQARFQVNFPLFEKVHATGSEISPLYKTLTQESPSEFQGSVKWNFTKFLINAKGEIIGRFSSGDKPTGAEMRKAIEDSLKAK